MTVLLESLLTIGLLVSYAMGWHELLGFTAVLALMVQSRMWLRKPWSLYALLYLLIVTVPVLYLCVLGPIFVFDVLPHSDALITAVKPDLLYAIIMFSVGFSHALVVAERYPLPNAKLVGYERWPLSRLQTILAAAVCVAGLFIYQPSLPFFGAKYFDYRYNALPGQGWNYVCFSAFAILWVAGAKGRLRTIVLWLVPVWLLLHYDRAEVLGMVFLALATGSHKRPGWRLTRTTLIWVVAILLFVVIGAVRLDPQSASINAQRFLMIDTVQDVVHNGAAAVTVTDTHGTTISPTQYVHRLIPSVFSFSYDGEFAEKIIYREIGTHYGSYLIGEAYMAGRGVGALLFGVGLALAPVVWIRLGRIVGGALPECALVLMILASARVAWYGPMYYVKPLLVILLPLWFVLQLCETRKNVATNRAHWAPAPHAR